MDQSHKTPIVIGETGHRNLVNEDKPLIKEQIKTALEGILKSCKSTQPGGEDTPVVMLNAFAQGADMLCAEVAFELGIDVCALLPCPKEEYAESFDDEEDKAKLFTYLDRAKGQIIAPDMEQSEEWLLTQGVDKDSYAYRQLGIYMAEHSHILLALWDGKPPKSPFGCGTAEVVNFALEHEYLNREHLLKSGVNHDNAVLWVKVRRQGDGDQADVKTKWLFADQKGYEERADKEQSEYDQFIKKLIRRVTE